MQLALTVKAVFLVAILVQANIGELQGIRWMDTPANLLSYARALSNEEDFVEIFVLESDVVWKDLYELPY